MKILFLSWLISFIPMSFAMDCKPPLTDEYELPQYNFIIVPGIFNETIPYYMTEYRKLLRLQGVPSGQVLKYDNWTLSRPEENVERMYNKILTMPSDPELVFFGHSKGALETLYLILEKPEIRRRLKHVFLIQGPLDGVSSYELMYSKRAGSLTKNRPFFALLRFLSKIPFVKRLYQGFRQGFVRLKLQDHKIPEDKELLSKMTFVVSSEEVSRMKRNFKMFGRLYLEYFKEKSDGIILTKEQVPEGINESNACIKEVQADHGKLVRAWPFAKKKRAKIRIFIKNLLFGTRF